MELINNAENLYSSFHSINSSYAVGCNIAATFFFSEFEHQTSVYRANTLWHHGIHANSLQHSKQTREILNKAQVLTVKINQTRREILLSCCQTHSFSLTRTHAHTRTHTHTLHDCSLIRMIILQHTHPNNICVFIIILMISMQFFNPGGMEVCLFPIPVKLT